MNNLLKSLMKNLATMLFWKGNMNEIIIKVRKLTKEELEAYKKANPDKKNGLTDPQYYKLIGMQGDIIGTETPCCGSVPIQNIVTWFRNQTDNI